MNVRVTTLRVLQGEFDRMLRSLREVAIPAEMQEGFWGAVLYGMGEYSLQDDRGRMAESQLAELRNMRVLLEEVRVLARNLAYHRRARLESAIGEALDEVDRQIEELHADEERRR
jgi:hypothetical protein